MERKTKYIVMKREDVEKYLSKAEKDHLVMAGDAIAKGRTRDGKKTSNRYVVVNQDEPYAEEVWKLIEKEEDRKAAEKKVELTEKQVAVLEKCLRLIDEVKDEFEEYYGDDEDMSDRWDELTSFIETIEYDIVCAIDGSWDS